jgi:hypothetical protein
MTVSSAFKKLDLARGVRLARLAYESRMKQPAPAVTEGRFELGPRVLKTYTAEELADAGDGR